MEQIEPPNQCPGCKATRFTWFRYETLGAKNGDKYVVACGSCGHNYLLNKRPVWGGLDIEPNFMTGIPRRTERARKQGV